MSLRLVLAVVFVLSVGLGGCVVASSTSSGDGGNARTSRVATPTSAVGPTIVALRTHDGVISITSAHGGLRVTLATTTGEVTARDLTLDELRTQNPEAYDLVSTSRAFLDASIDRGAIERADVPGAPPALR